MNIFRPWGQTPWKPHGNRRGVSDPKEPNELLDACSKAGLKKPTIEADDIHFRLIIWRREVKMKINEDKNEDKLLDDEKIIAFIRKRPDLTIPQYAKELKIKASTMRSAISRLERENGLVHIGARKTGRWAFQSKSAGFDSARGMGYEKEVSPTLTTKSSSCVMRIKNRK